MKHHDFQMISIQTAGAHVADDAANARRPHMQAWDVNGSRSPAGGPLASSADVETFCPVVKQKRYETRFNCLSIVQRS